MIGAVDYTMATAIECRTPDDAARLAEALEYTGHACACSHRVVDTSAGELEARAVAMRLVARGTIAEPWLITAEY